MADVKSIRPFYLRNSSKCDLEANQKARIPLGCNFYNIAVNTPDWTQTSRPRLTVAGVLGLHLLP